MKKYIFLLLIILLSGCQSPKLGVSDITVEKVSQKFNESTKLKAKYTLDGTNLKRVAKDNPKDKIEVTIGKSNELLGGVDEFTPDIKLSRWEEVSFSLQTDKLLKDVSLNDKKISFEDEKIIFDTPKISFEMFETQETPEGGYKYIWYLNEKPKTNIVSFKIESQGLDFFYQPPLDEEYPESDNCSPTECDTDGDGELDTFRPENIVGSYAVFHSSKGGMNDINGKDYKTGKAFHIYRPHLFDAGGKEAWGILHIGNGIYSVEIPQEFLDKAVYPVKSNDTFGYTDVFATATFYSAGKIEGAFATSTDTGTVSSISYYMDGFAPGYTNNHRAILYAVSDGSRNGYTDQAVSATNDAWNTVNLMSGGSISATSYWIAIWTGTSMQGRSESVASGSIDVSESYSSSVPPASIGSTPTTQNVRYSIYATYTATEAGTSTSSIKRQSEFFIE